MARRCGFCDRWFRSKQSVRAHQRWCQPYLEAKEAGLVAQWWASPCGYMTKQAGAPQRACSLCGSWEWEAAKPPPGA